jgi:hypothetical protein
MIPTLPEIVMGIMERHAGERNGVTRKALLAQVNERLSHYGQDPMDDRALRRCYVTLPLISGDFGLCIPADMAEIQNFEMYIFSKVPGDDAARRVRIIKGAYPHLAPQPKQMGLPGMGVEA